MEFIALVIGVAVLGALIAWIVDIAGRARRYTELKPRLDRLEEQERRFGQAQAEWARKAQEEREAISTLAAEKSIGFPWLAQAYADYYHLRDLERARHLESKSHPAKKAADALREIAAERRHAEKLWRVLKYQLQYYEVLFPWLVDFRGEDIDDLIRQLSARAVAAEGADAQDPARHWLTEAEYSTLSRPERYQLALDRYWKKKKSRWELGRDYERYIGYQYESKGYQVRYQGIVEGLADLGRDLIAVRDETVQVVQCKCWSLHKMIHEKHIFQLYGTLVAYRIDHPHKRASGVFVTSTRLSPRAKQFAEALGISYREQVLLEPTIFALS
mgnify:CR=1 FL=1